ncbi:hypothetical protein H4R21_005176 [Coemansia helicoidea]|uniref:Uncharacterized protein n=1 Tax=Coemansia helicoidea TaxID=1286919 RepID=A0ACC1KUD0_9FUNG|nr:hypothetical protein H4R21_005176 [Coemansia helicoidea]
MRLLGVTGAVLAGTMLAGRAVEARAPCDSPIYCQGEVLHAVQMAGLFGDNKEFVDMPTRRPVAQVLEAFAQLGANASRDALGQFVADNFGAADAEVQAVAVEGLDAHPRFLERVRDPLLRAFGGAVNGYWSQLVRAQNLTGLCPGCASSMLALPHRFVVPGGRFREIYYWDTYFSLEGMLRSGLTELSRETILNLLALVDRHGFVPNGARVYYLGRSQPPMLTLMVQLFHQFTGDVEFVRAALPLLQREHRYWTEHHSVAIQGGPANETLTLSRYITDTDVPRPEAYSVDYRLAHSASADDGARRGRIYEDLAAAAESGWDFSTRWVRDPDAPRAVVLQTIRTSQVVPADLNAILYQTELALADLADLVHAPAPEDYRQLAARRRRAMDHVMLDPESGEYRDFVLDNGGRRSDIPNAGGLWPYWAFGGPAAAATRAFAAVGRELDANAGGIPATLRDSGLQWDWPEAWPPLQYVAMQAALRTGHDEVARRVAQAFVDTVFCGWYATGGSLPGVLLQLPNATDSGHIFEKYSSQQIGAPGGGGEYSVQPGFGWTNGVLLWTLDVFGPQLVAPQCPALALPTVPQP